MRRIIISLLAFVTMTGAFAQNYANGERDYIVTRQKTFDSAADAMNWAWDPIWGQNFSGNTYEPGRSKVKESIRFFFKNRMDKEVKKNPNNTGTLLFVINGKGMLETDFWHFSGFKWQNRHSSAEQGEALYVSAGNREFMVEQLNKFLEPFDFEIQLAKNSEIGRARYRNLLNNYSEWWVYITVPVSTDKHPQNYANFKKAVEKNFNEIVKKPNENLPYFPFYNEVNKYIERLNRQNGSNRGQHEEETGNDFGTDPIRVGH